MQPYMTLSADVLIVGGGSAGVMAAIRAKQMDPGQRVVVFEKGDMQYSGCIARGMDAMNIVAVPGTEETPELYVETNREACQGIMDEPVNYAMAKRTWAVMKELMDWGVCFPVDEKGQFDKLQIHSKGKFCITMKEPELTEEEKAELARKEALKDKRHQQYMIRKAEGRDANYNKQVARRRAQQREDRRKTRRWEDIQAGIYHIAGTTVINAKNGTEDAEPILVSASRPRA